MTNTLLLCIGAQKAGTTWLADYFREHSVVHMPPVKEVHFFDARFAPKWCAKYEEEMLAEFQAEAAGLTLETCGDPALQQKLHAMLLRFRMIANPGEYIRFMSWGAQGRSVLFEATPDYSMVDETGFRAMKDMHPDTRLIFLLRNPADRYWSSMKFNRTHNSAFDIDTMFDRLIDREDFMLLADYDRTIREALKIFEPGKLHIEFMSGCSIRLRLTGFAGLPESRRARPTLAAGQMHRSLAICLRNGALKLLKPMRRSIARSQSDFKAIYRIIGKETWRFSMGELSRYRALASHRKCV